MFQTPITVDLSDHGCPGVSAQIYPHAPTSMVTAFEESIQNANPEDTAASINQATTVVAHGVVAFKSESVNVPNWGDIYTASPSERAAMLEARKAFAKLLPPTALTHLATRLIDTFYLDNSEKKP